MKRLHISVTKTPPVFSQVTAANLCNKFLVQIFCWQGGIPPPWVWRPSTRQYYQVILMKPSHRSGIKIPPVLSQIAAHFYKKSLVQIFCCHGGIPPPWVCPLVTSIDKVPNPLPKPAEQSSIAWELLWNDPIKWALARPFNVYSVLLDSFWAFVK